MGLPQGAPIRIAMTAPVGMVRHSDHWQMTFTMPADSTMVNLPQPTDARVTLREVSRRQVAVLTFSGLATEARAQVAKLEKALTRESLIHLGEPELQQYNPPWTPAFMRRNEIWIEVDKLDSASVSPDSVR